MTSLLGGWRRVPSMMADLGIQATKEDWRHFCIGVAGALAMAGAGAGVVGLALLALGSDWLRSSWEVLFYAGGAVAWAVGAVLVWKTSPGLKGRHGAWGRAAFAAAGGVLATMLFSMGMALVPLGYCLSALVQAAWMGEAPPPELAVQGVEVVLLTVFVLAFTCALCGGMIVIMRSQQRAVR